MQALGFTFALLPLLDGRSAAVKADFVRRHLGYVNTNPALSGVLLGSVARAESQILASGAGGEEAAEQTAALKRRLEGPLAALGDRTFWGWLRPLLGILGTFLLLSPGAGRGIGGLLRPGPGGSEASAFGDLGWAWASVLAALAFYNGPYLVTRWRAVTRGLVRTGEDPGPAEAAGGFGVARIAHLCTYLGPLLLGALAGRLAITAWQAAAATTAGGVRGAALLVAGGLLGTGAARLGLPPERMAMIVLAFLLLTGVGR
jgi:hypothetical protein